MSTQYLNYTKIKLQQSVSPSRLKKIQFLQTSPDNSLSKTLIESRSEAFFNQNPDYHTTLLS